MCEPDEWSCKSDGTNELERPTTSDDNQPDGKVDCCSTGKRIDFAFHCGQSLSEDDDELTESKIRAFLDEKVFHSFFFYLFPSFFCFNT